MDVNVSLIFEREVGLVMDRLKTSSSYEEAKLRLGGFGEEGEQRWS
jgi:hypothetical protein